MMLAVLRVAVAAGGARRPLLCDRARLATRCWASELAGAVSVFILLAVAAAWRLRDTSAAAGAATRGGDGDEGVLLAAAALVPGDAAAAGGGAGGRRRRDRGLAGSWAVIGFAGVHGYLRLLSWVTRGRGRRQLLDRGRRCCWAGAGLRVAEAAESRRRSRSSPVPRGGAAEVSARSSWRAARRCWWPHRSCGPTTSCSCCSVRAGVAPVRAGSACLLAVVRTVRVGAWSHSHAEHAAAASSRCWATRLMAA